MVSINAKGAPNPSDLRLCIGPWVGKEHSLRETDYLVDATGWTAIGRRGGTISDYSRTSSSGPAAALAGAIGAGDLFKRAIGHKPEHWMRSVYWCTWDHTLLPDSHSELRVRGFRPKVMWATC
jgi:hypothetical protein